MKIHRLFFMRRRRACSLFVLACIFSATVFAAPAAVVDEQRFQHLAAGFRCLVCQNQSIADSSAALAIDLRTQISEQMAAGKCDDEIRTYMVSRYGDFILYSPPWKMTTLLLWLGPFAVLLLALVAGVFLVWRRARLATLPADTDVAAVSRSERRWQQENK